MSNSVRPHRRQPTRLRCPWGSSGKNTGVGCHFLLQSMKVKSESEVAQSCLTLSDPMDCSLQAPPSMGFSRQEYWSGVPLHSPRLDRLVCCYYQSESQNGDSKCWVEAIAILLDMKRWWRKGKREEKRICYSKYACQPTLWSIWINLMQIKGNQ